MLSLVCYSTCIITYHIYERVQNLTTWRVTVSVYYSIQAVLWLLSYFSVYSPFDSLKKIQSHLSSLRVASGCSFPTQFPVWLNVSVPKMNACIKCKRHCIFKQARGYLCPQNSAFEQCGPALLIQRPFFPDK